MQIKKEKRLKTENWAKIKRMIGFDRKIGDDDIIAKCEICGAPILGVPFLKKYRDKKISPLDKYFLNQLLILGKVGAKFAHLVGIENVEKPGSDEKDVIAAILAFHFAMKHNDTEHKKVLQKVVEIGDHTPILARIEWNMEKKREFDLVRMGF